MNPLLKTKIIAMMLVTAGILTACGKSDTPETVTPSNVSSALEADAAPMLKQVLPIPFRIHMEPMDRLLLVNFEEDPDSLYKGFDPQVFDDTVNGRGQLVIGWRVDGRVDVFHDPVLSPDPSGYDIAGKGLANMVERDLSGSGFIVDEFGVQANYRFEDIHGRLIEFSVNERSTRERRPFGLLAPMGDAVENPPSLPLILLHEFYFVRRKNSDIMIRIGGREHATDMLPIPIDRSRMTFIRYCTDPLIAMLNPEMDGTMKVLEVDGKGTHKLDPENEYYIFSSGDTEYLLRFNDGVAVLGGLQRRSDNHLLKLAFEPPFPNLAHLADDALIEGNFRIAGDPSTGIIEGEYIVSSSDGVATITMVPSGGWSPDPDRLSLRFLYRVAEMFRTWPESYRWTAVITREIPAQDARAAQDYKTARDYQTAKDDQTVRDRKTAQGDDAALEEQTDKRPLMNQSIHTERWHMRSHWERTHR